MRKTVMIAAAGLALLWGGARADTPRVVATVGMIGDIAAEVAGPCAEIEVMMGPGIDPHLYRPSAGDVRGLFAADMLLYAGHHLEGQLSEVLGRLEGRKPAIAVAEAAVGGEHLIRPAGSDYADPHLWMDAALWARTAPVLAGALAAVAPDCAADMAARAEAYAVMVDALDGWVRQSIASIPEDRRVLVTAHDAFAYFGRAYGIEVEGIQGISTDSEAGIGDIRAIVDLVAARGVPAIFVESTISPRTVEAVVAAAADRGQDLRIGGELYSDALGEAGTPAGTYIGMIHSNAQTITEALGGTVPPLPPALDPWARRWNLGG